VALNPYQRLSEAERELRLAADQLRSPTLRVLAAAVRDERRALAQSMAEPPVRAPAKPRKPKPRYVDAMDKRAPGHFGAKTGG